MNPTQSNRSCPQCEQPLPPDAPEGLCPECLMLGALETMPMPEHLKPSGRLPEPGEVFGGYRIGRELGRGGMGAVFEAEQLDTGRLIALKLLNHQLDSPEARARFLREGRLAASINHPNSVYVFGTEEIGEMPAISMELVGGGTLEEIVKERGALPIGEAVDMISQVVEGLEAAEEIGILHRDVKPGNCFRDVDGTVKIGDFGLSISTEARDENHLTMDGTIFGTPAFSSPEQLRGDELNVQSDIYAVGATLYYLLTGKAAFGGKSMARLFANVLESKPPSPKQSRPDVPEGLAAIVLRCLKKIPSERFGSYLEFRKALAPFKSDAPIPGSPLMRFLAGIVDWTLYTSAAMAVQLFIHGGLISPEQMEPGYMLASFVIALFCWTLYFGLMEGRTGFSLGKGLCRLRVADQNGNPPGFLKAALRGFLVLLLPSLPMWIMFGVDPSKFAMGESTAWSLGLGFSFYVILALLFMTMRRRNGYASVLDLLTKTRVIRKKSFQDRPAFTHEAETPVETGGDSRKIGPYHVLETLSRSGDSEWVIGYDTRLLRKIWIRMVPEDTPSVSQKLRKLGRVGRLRWLAERREPGENWDAYESPGGDALINIVGKEKPGWDQMRYWLLDLSEELDTAEKDDTIPDTLAIDRIWITSSGRAKLLDFTIVESKSQTPPATSPDDLLRQVSDLVSQRLPLQAVSLRDRMNAPFAPADLAREIRPLLSRFTTVSRLRRFALIAGCSVFPLFITISMIFGIDMMKKWHRDHPDEFSLHNTLNYRQISQYPMMDNQDFPSDELFSIYIANHYGDLVESEAWNGTTAMLFIQGPQRQFVEKSIKEYPDLTAKQIAGADEAIDDQVKQMTNMFDEFPRWMPLAAAASGYIIYVGLPAILASLICRGGLVMLACGVGVARADGTRATRLRCFWRSLVTWSPWFLGPFLLAVLAPLLGSSNAVIIGVLIVLLAIISLMLPNRSLQDRIAGTYIVPR